MVSVTDRVRQGARALLHHSPFAVSSPTFSVAFSLPIPFAMPVLERRGERLALRGHPALATLQLSVCSNAWQQALPPAPPRRTALRGPGFMHRLKARRPLAAAPVTGEGPRPPVNPAAAKVRRLHRLPPGRLPASPASRSVDAGARSIGSGRAGRHAKLAVAPRLQRLATRCRQSLSAWLER
ncbi:MAG: hypothetical protein K0R03_705 [Moraxellaceae bacterium]|jgi:hypothetical protein|nr:hypothetical protein [Moraxellaceae bacterium]